MINALDGPKETLCWYSSRQIVALMRSVKKELKSWNLSLNTIQLKTIECDKYFGGKRSLHSKPYIKVDYVSLVKEGGGGQREIKNESFTIGQIVQQAHSIKFSSFI